MDTREAIETSARMNMSETRPILTIRHFAKIAIASPDLLRDTGESGDAYDAEAQTEAERVSRTAV